VAIPCWPQQGMRVAKGNCHVVAHLIAAGPNGWPNARNDVGWAAAKRVDHGLNGRADYARHCATPARVRQPDHLLARVVEQNWRAVRKAQHQEHTRMACDQGVRLWAHLPSMLSADDPHSSAVHLVRRDHVAPFDAERLADQPMVGFHGLWVVPNGMPGVQTRPRGQAVASQAGEQAVRQIGTVQQMGELVVHQRSIRHSLHLAGLPHEDASVAQSEENDKPIWHVRSEIAENPDWQQHQGRRGFAGAEPVCYTDCTQWHRMDECSMRTLYGPVDSWRFGRSLGVDPLAGKEKRCPLSCTYCQYGPTGHPTMRREAFVTPGQLREDIRSLGTVDADTITFAGLGEPTLAANLSELAAMARKVFTQPLIVLTGSALFPVGQVQRDLLAFDVVIAKLDAPDDELFRQINRPAAGYSYPLAAVVEGIRSFRQAYAGRLVLQMMFVQANKQAAPQMAALAHSLEPDEVQLNTPLQPAFGGPLSAAEMQAVEKEFVGLAVRSVYRDGQARIRPRSM